MSIFKHPVSGVWYVDFVDARGKRTRRSTKTKDKDQAQRFEATLKLELWEVKASGKTDIVTFDKAALEYLKSIDHLRDQEAKKLHVRHWRSHFGSQDICSLTTDMIEAATPQTSAAQYGHGKPLTGASKNRYLATLSKILHDARKRGWLTAVPYIRKHSESKGREFYLTEAQAQSLLRQLGEGWMFDVCAFALNTGMRAGEILSLEWSQVNLERRIVSIHPSQAKSGHGRAVPLNEGAYNVLISRQKLHKRYVFTRRGSLVAQIDSKIFARAVKLAGLPKGITFHTLRHTWASFHAMAGTPLLTLQQLGGWRSLSMVNRYAHLAGEGLADYANNALISAQSGKPLKPRSHLKVVNG